MEKLIHIHKKYVHPILVIAMHIAAVVAIYFSFLPIAKWYLDYRPLWGVDFHLSLSIANLIAQHPVFPYALWNYAGFAGWPQYLYPSLSSYLIAFFSQFYGLVLAAQMVVMGATLLFIVGTYFLFFALSKNTALAAVLAIFVGFCGGVYQVLTWAGSLPSYIAQAAYPWAIGFLVLFLKTKNYRYLLACALAAGISIWIHPLVFIAYILPTFGIIVALTFSKEISFFLKLKTLLIFLFISLVIGLPQFYQAIGPALKSPVQTSGANALSTTRAAPSQLETDTANFNRLQVKRLVTDNFYAIFYILAICAILFVVASVFTLRLGGVFEVLPWGLLAAYFVFYIWLFGEGISIYHGGWYRLFWSVPVWIGALCSALWFSAHESIAKRVKTELFRFVFILGSCAILIVSAYPFWGGAWNMTIDSIIYRSEVSSAYPDALNLKVTKEERDHLKTRLVPSWINGDETNWRIYDADQTVNIWWNNIFKMPLARGYIDTPIAAENRGFSFLLDSALSEEGEGIPQLSDAFKFPEETAISTALFLIDWNAVKYFEGPHVSVVNKPLPVYLKDLLLKRNEILTFDDLRYTKRPLTLNYSEIKDEMTSPILSGTNAPTVGIFASEEGYEIVNRALSERGNLNSQVLIPINLGRKVDAVDADAISKFDALYLHDYDYDNQGKAFKLLRNFLENGKKIYVDTGTEVKETNGDLPDDIFPVKAVTRRGQGKEWGLKSPDKYLTGDVDLKKFSEPVFDGSEWSISYANAEDVKTGARVILTNHDKPIMASMKVGNGELIWGGFNLAYHIIRDHNLEEAKLFDNILGSMVSLQKKPLPQSTVEFKSPNERKATTTGAKGVLFKEQAYKGWSARLRQDSGGQAKSLAIYKAGPTYPGFIYVFLPTTDKTTVEFSFAGSLRDKALVWLSVVVAILIFEEVAFCGFVFGRLRKLAWFHSRRKIGRWWQREDEE